MKRIFLYFCILVSSLFFYSCDNDNPSGLNYGKIEGRVFDSETNEPLHGVELFTEPPSSNATTSQNGFYRFVDLAPRDYVIRVSKHGYKSKKVTVLVQSSKVTNADILLEKGTGNSTDDDDDNPDKTPYVELDDYLVLYMKFDGNPMDASKNKYNGTQFSVSYTSDRKGKPNSAISFSGSSNSYVHVDQNHPFNLSEFTYSCWLNPNSGFGVPYQGFIDFISRWGHWGPNNQSYAFSLSTSGKIKGMIYNLVNSNEGHPENYTVFETDKSITPNTWTHVAIIYKNGRLYIYINGGKVLDIKSLQPQYSSSYGLFIGKRPETIQLSAYSGAMDDLRIYNMALSDTQIKALYEHEK